MIDDGLPEAAARQRFFAVDRDGLLVEGMTGLQSFQAPFAQPRAAVADWSRSHLDRIDLLDVVKNARPTVLIGVSGQPGMFTEEVVRTMAGAVARPVIFPLSNPVSRSEATPADLLRRTNGRALVGTGSPFSPVEIDGKPITVDQTNNAYVFPGVGLGVLAVRAQRVSDDMFAATAQALAAVSPAARDPGANLLPPGARSAQDCGNRRRRRRPPGPRRGCARSLRTPCSMASSRKRCGNRSIARITAKGLIDEQIL
jgi:malate dehydrogenase (oxaloacetate-decarboxylating)